MEKYKLIDAVETFQDKKILTVGDVAIDRYVYGTVDRINPENPGAPLIRKNREEYRLGGAGNVAMNISSLGAKALLGGLIGEDKNGLILGNLCNKNNINSFFSLRKGENIVKERFIESDHNHYVTSSSP